MTEKVASFATAYAGVAVSVLIAVVLGIVAVCIVKKLDKMNLSDPWQ